MAVLARHGVAGSLKNSWDSGLDSGGTVAWAGARIKADPTGLTLKKLVEALRGTVEEDNEGERCEGEDRGGRGGLNMQRSGARGRRWAASRRSDAQTTTAE